jgi:hypothetical protein
MGDHLNTKKDPSKHHARGFSEAQDLRLARARRVTFKQYVHQLEDDLLDEQQDAEEWIVECGSTEGDETIWHEAGTYISEEEADTAADELRDADALGNEYRVRKV